MILTLAFSPATFVAVFLHILLKLWDLTSTLTVLMAVSSKLLVTEN